MLFRLFALVLLCSCSTLVSAADTVSRATHNQHSVSTELRLHSVTDNKGILEATLKPTRLGNWHLYSKDLPADNTLGMATQVVIKAGSWLTATGPAQSTTPVKQQIIPGFDPIDVYVSGPVVITIPVSLDPAQFATGPATVLLTYMACDDTTCLPPVQDAPVKLPPPAEQTSQSAPPVATTSDPPADQPQTEVPEQEHNDAAVHQALAQLTASTKAPKQHTGPADLSWWIVTSPEEIKHVIDAAAAKGQASFLDFTGLSCVNCQVNARNVFPRPQVKEGLAQLALIEIDTDIHTHLGVWQRQVFGTTTRPYYVRIDPNGTITRWSQALGSDSTDFVAFLHGAEGQDLRIDGFWSLVVLSILGGLFTLIMPCTYPMIPLTVNFFTKQAAMNKNVGGLALLYGGGIVVSFVGIALIAGLVFGSDATALAGNKWTNYGIALLFIVLGLSLLGAFTLLFPSGLQGRILSALPESGYIGALLMGLTFAITAFTCTAPVAGLMLGAAINTGSWGQAVFGMTIYASVIAIPFILLAMFPRYLQRLPKAGAWMNEFKIIGGIIEIAASLKFLAVAVAASGMTWLTRELVFGSWAIAALFCTVFILGLIRFGDVEGKIRPGIVRLLFAIIFAIIAIYMAWGAFFGGHLGSIEGWLPGKVIPTEG